RVKGARVGREQVTAARVLVGELELMLDRLSQQLEESSEPAEGAAGLAREKSELITGPEARQATWQEVERRLHEVHARFETAFSNAPIGMALVDMAGEWLQVNDALCRITGYTADELKATTLAELTHPDDVASDADEQRQLLAGRIE